MTQKHLVPRPQLLRWNALSDSNHAVIAARLHDRPLHLGRAGMTHEHRREIRRLGQVLDQLPQLTVFFLNRRDRPMQPLDPAKQNAIDLCGIVCSVFAQVGEHRQTLVERHRALAALDELLQHIHAAVRGFFFRLTRHASCPPKCRIPSAV